MSDDYLFKGTRMSATKRAPRWVHRLYALFNLYFWLPCPTCRKPFGGHEVARDPVAINGNVVCPTCAAKWRDAMEALDLARIAQKKAPH